MTAHIHSCPGGCGRELVGQVFACVACTRRLPDDIRHAINASWWANDWPAHTEALLGGLRFYAVEQRHQVHSGESGELA